MGQQERSQEPTHIDLNWALRNTFALVLAGGRGTRLMHLTGREAKPALPFGGQYRIIDFALSNCLNSGIRRVGVPTQYRAHNLIQHIQRGWSFLKAELNEFVEVWPAQQQTAAGTWYEGTADAVYQNLMLLEEHEPEHVLVLGGDHIYKQDYSKMLEEHIRRGADVSVACVSVEVSKASAFGVVDVDEEDWIVRFLEKPSSPPSIPGEPGRAFASMGIYVFDFPFLMDRLRKDAESSESSHDFGKDIIPSMIKQDKVLAHRFERSCIFNENAEEPYWRDVGTVDAFWEANVDLANVTPALDLYDPDWPIWTYSVQRPAAKFVFDDEDRRGMAVDSVVSAGCIVSGSLVRRSVLYTDCRINSYSTVEEAVLLPGVEVGRNCHLEKVVVDRHVRIPEGTEVGRDPVADAKRFFRTEDGVVLITQSMIDELSPSSATSRARS
jgi:glucose-1-phosphate adenylyltransferase